MHLIFSLALNLELLDLCLASSGILNFISSFSKSLDTYFDSIKFRNEAQIFFPMVISTEKLPEGVVFVAKRNMKDRFFLASKENGFGDWNCCNVLVDTGISSHLLPLFEGDLEKLIDKFSPDLHKWAIGRSNGVAATSLTLQVSHKAELFKVNLCKDMKDVAASEDFSVEYLRFHLCFEDARELCDPSKKAHVLYQCMPAKYQIMLQEFVTGAIPSRRRTHGLLGQSFLSDPLITTAQQRGIQVGLVTQLHRSLDLFSIQDFEKFIVSTPDNFDDLEDDDHIGDDITTNFRNTGDVLIG